MWKITTVKYTFSAADYGPVRYPDSQITRKKKKPDLSSKSESLQKLLGRKKMK